MAEHQGARIALINDDTAFLELMHDLLTSIEGYDVLICKESNDAYGFVKQEFRRLGEAVVEQPHITEQAYRFSAGHPRFELRDRLFEKRTSARRFACVEMIGSRIDKTSRGAAAEGDCQIDEFGCRRRSPSGARRSRSRIK